MKKEQFLSLEIEIEKKLNMIKTKNVMSAKVGALQDACILTSDDAVNGEHISSLIKPVNSMRVNEEI